jgi:zinc protease
MMNKAIIALAVVVYLGCASGKKSQGFEPGDPSETEAAQAQETAAAPANVEALAIPSRPLAKPKPMQSVLLPVPNKPVVTIRLVFHTGSVDDPKGKEGLTALTTTLMEQGGTKSLTASQLIDALFPTAGELSAYTDKEFTTFSGRVHQDKLDAFLKIFTDTILEPRFDPEDFKRVKSEALSTLKNGLRSENDESLGKVGLEALLYKDHPYRHFTVGTVQGLESIQLYEVKAHWKKVFTQDRLVVGLAGAVTPELEKQVLTRLSALPASGAPRVEIPDAQPQPGKTVIIEKEALSTAISFGEVYGLRRGDPDFFAVAAGLSMLGEHRQFHGVLFSELREKRGLNYGTYAYAEHFIQEGGSSFSLTNIGRAIQEFSIWIRPVEPSNAIFATRGALHFLQEALTQPIPAERFEIGRGFLLGYTRLWEATDERRLGYAIDDVFYGTGNFLESYRKALSTMTPDQVRKALKRHIVPQQLSFVFVTHDAKALADALAQNKPSPISYPTPKAADVLELDKKISVFPLPIQGGEIEIVPASSVMER